MLQMPACKASGINMQTSYKHKKIFECNHLILIKKKWQGMGSNPTLSATGSMRIRVSSGLNWLADGFAIAERWPSG